MPRKKINNSSETFSKLSAKPVKFIERDGRMITSEKMYIFDDTSSAIVGVAMANETVKILEQSVSDDHMTKIRTYGSKREGYVNHRSVI